MILSFMDIAGKLNIENFPANLEFSLVNSTLQPSLNADFSNHFHFGCFSLQF